MNRTALYGIHKELGAKIIEFAGWEMPVVYSGVREEHLTVRNRVGLFDISHMGEIEVCGSDAASFCQRVTTNDVSKLKEFQAQYGFFCNAQGGMIDDVITYKFSDERFFICVNAANTTKDYEWVKGNKNGFDVELHDRSAEFSQLALQGPDSEAVLREALQRDFSNLGRFCCRFENWKGFDLIVARTGYTGEEGFEIFLPWGRESILWNEILTKGTRYGIKPCGLGARDTLRIEMGYPLYGHEIDEDTNPVEAGLGRYVKIDKGDFIGKEAIISAVECGLRKKLVGFEMIDRGIPRQGYDILKDGVVVGNVTSGTQSPSLDKPIGMGYLRKGIESCGEVEIEIRKNRRRAIIVLYPFIEKKRLKKERSCHGGDTRRT